MNILLIRFSSLGDIVLATGVVEALKLHLPDARLFFLTKAAYAQLFEHDDRIHRLVTIGKDERLSSIREKCGPEGFDAVIDLHGSLRSRMAAMLVPARRIMRVNKHSLGRRLMILTRNGYRKTFDTLGGYCGTLEFLGIRTRMLPKLVPSFGAVQNAEKALSRSVGSFRGRVIGIAPGARHDTKRWNEESFAALADALAERGDTPVIIGDGADRPVAEWVRSAMKGDAVSFAGELDLADTIGLVSRLDGFVANDSGPMHIAGALDVPVVGVFGPTHPDLGFWPGYPMGSCVHTGIPCSPCSLHGSTPCRKDRRFCMDDMPWERVLEELDNVMNRR